MQATHTPTTRRRRFPLLAIAALVTLSGCRSGALDQQPDPGVGTAPALPAPQRKLIPTVAIAPATGWPDGATPIAADGLQVRAFATGLDHPRWLHVLPNGDVLVAESNGPAGKSGIRGVRGAVMKQVMKRAGAGVPSADRISLLRDGDGDGVAETRTVLLSNLHSPFGMALVGDTLYVANADALVRVPYTAGASAITATPTKLVDLPGGGDQLNHHWTKSLLASADGQRLYVGVGSNSNVGENGMDAEVDRAAVLEVDIAGATTRVFASGLRNPVGMAWRPGSNELWTVVNERDELGDNLVPDYLTHVVGGAFYGWPYSYFGANVDTRVQPPRPDLVARARTPDYALGNHVAPLGLAFNTSTTLPARWRDGAFVGLHGSWNRKPRAGYKVVFVPFTAGKPDGLPQDVLTGFVDADGNARGRPVGVAIARDGALLVADDVGNAVWRVAAATP
ncbi:MAG: sorbosone dehydrogenase family protein [Pseudomonas sp.]|nr:sorbosone dehydrogenase family protein [Pseudomonas sp.]